MHALTQEYLLPRVCTFDQLLATMTVCCTDSDFDQRSQTFTIRSGAWPGIILRPTLPIVDDLIEEDIEGFIAVLDILQITEGALLNNTARRATVIRIFDDDSEYS